MAKPNPSNQHEVDDLKSIIFGLTIACPFSPNDAPSHCQLREIRKLPLAERLAWMKQLTDEERLQFYQNHLQCLKKRESAHPDEHKKTAS
ncbi:hypothetical protein [Persicirhabdus sediminis]|uniref:Uncharacterized protein n=1 Tax=Persicirhabdus sediminis TaxID=454144 RepID=A0A8J7MJH6_9BACT|nr:hypothetical protein [Persicirhabdus sediminis]MBK1792148.1 hypothetical protein [Persicirhabdus sediminis]